MRTPIIEMDRAVVLSILVFETAEMGLDKFGETVWHE